MGGRIHGFLGGLLLGLALTYYQAYQFHSNGWKIQQLLRRAKATIDDRNKPAEVAPAKVAFSYRPGGKETFADLWNDEVIRGVNWVYSINWVAVEENLELKVRRVADYFK